MKRIKVCVLTSVHPAFDNRIFHKQCRTLAAAGYEVVLIVPHGQDEYVDGVRIRAVSKPKSRLRRVLRTTWQVYTQALKEKADVYHIHDPELLTWAQVLRFTGKPVIYDMHENVPKSIVSKHWINPVLRQIVSKLYNWVERVFLLNSINVIFAENSYTKDYNWKNGTVILNVPHLGSFPVWQGKYDRPTVGYIGGVSRLRGSLVTARALNTLKERGYHVDWECIGPISNGHKREIMEIVGPQGISIRGYMLPYDGWSIIAKCHIGLAILQPIPNYLESYPTKMFEYMALGLPVIASSFPLYREIVDGNNCGICVDPTNSTEIAQAIQWLIDHPEDAVSMGTRGQEAVRNKYNWSTEANKLLELYDILLAPGKR